MNIEFNYFDACNNHYKITPKLLIYDPMKPQFSSSGMYDGGDAKTCVLTAAQFEEIQEVILLALNTVSAHITDRMKGTGLLKMQEDNERASCILPMNSELKTNIEKVLEGIMNE